MIFTGMNHMAFITKDMEKTTRFYRDLLQMELFAGIGHDGFRHYFFKCGDGAIAFFEYDIAQPMEYDKFHGTPTDKPIGFDHVSLTVPSRADLFALKDRLEAADIEVTGAVDHGTMWSIYFLKRRRSRTTIRCRSPRKARRRSLAIGPRSPIRRRPSRWWRMAATVSRCARAS